MIHIGWKEYVALPKLKLPALKAKVDTGAATSALHAEEIVEYFKLHKKYVKFIVRPQGMKSKRKITCRARVIDERMIKDSGAHRELRYVIRTDMCMGDQIWPIELTLTNRGEMNFLMLIGRSALSKRVIIDVTHGYISGKPQLDLLKK